MQRFYLPPEQTGGEMLQLSDREAHHAVNVLRLRRGETVMVLNGRGERFTCTVTDLGKKQVTLQVIQREHRPPSSWRITLIQAIPKGKTMDTIVQKATELGTFRIIPLLSARTVAQIDSDRAESKVEHWEATAVEAAKQCGSPWLPIIEPPISTNALLARRDSFDRSFVASLRPEARHPRDDLKTDGANGPSKAGTVALWIGPEGDFTPEELDAIEAAGVRPITFGPLVLRADTAAIYGLSVLNYELQER